MLNQPVQRMRLLGREQAPGHRLEPIRRQGPLAAAHRRGGAVKQAASRLRRRYRELLREEIAETVAGPEEVAEEIRNLFSALQL